MKRQAFTVPKIVKNCNSTFKLQKSTKETLQVTEHFAHFRTFLQQIFQQLSSLWLKQRLSQVTWVAPKNSTFKHFGTDFSLSIQLRKLKLIEMGNQWPHCHPLQKLKFKCFVFASLLHRFLIETCAMAWEMNTGWLPLLCMVLLEMNNESRKFDNHCSWHNPKTTSAERCNWKFHNWCGILTAFCHLDCLVDCLWAHQCGQMCLDLKAFATLQCTNETTKENFRNSLFVFQCKQTVCKCCNVSKCKKVATHVLVCLSVSFTFLPNDFLTVISGKNNVLWQSLLWAQFVCFQKS